MKIRTVVRYEIDGREFDSLAKAKRHIEDRIFKHVQNGTAYAGAGSEQSKMRLELMRYVLENRADIASLLSADLTPEDEND